MSKLYREALKELTDELSSEGYPINFSYHDYEYLVNMHEVNLDSVNADNHGVVYRSKHMFIAEISPFKKCNYLFTKLFKVMMLEQAAFRVYAVVNGFRFIRVDGVYKEARGAGVKLLKELGSNKAHVRRTMKDNEFMGRITPLFPSRKALEYFNKRNEGDATAYSVAWYMGTIGTYAEEKIPTDEIAIHDYFCQAYEYGLPLA